MYLSHAAIDTGYGLRITAAAATSWRDGRMPRRLLRADCSVGIHFVGDSTDDPKIRVNGVILRPSFRIHDTAKLMDAELVPAQPVDCY